MSIKTTKEEIRKATREEYLMHLIESEKKLLEMEEEDMGREGSERLHKIAFQIASDVARQIDSASMETRVPAEKLLGAVVDQVKLQMKKS